MAVDSRGQPARVGRRRIVLADVVSNGPRAEVDVALVLAVDSSGSISQDRLLMQMRGYTSALRHPSFIEAVRATLASTGCL